MASKLFNRGTRGNALVAGTDAVGNFVQLENGIKQYALTTAITHNVTTTTAASGSSARTSHATGLGKVFISNGTVWLSVSGS